MLGRYMKFLGGSEGKQGEGLHVVLFGVDGTAWIEGDRNFEWLYYYSIMPFEYFLPIWEKAEFELKEILRLSLSVLKYFKDLMLGFYT